MGALSGVGLIKDSMLNRIQGCIEINWNRISDMYVNAPRICVWNMYICVERIHCSIA